MMAGNNAEGCERLGKLLFLKLDPTIRHLLSLFQRQQEINGAVARPAEDFVVSSLLDQKLEREEEILGLLREEADLLEQLQSIVLEFPQSALATAISLPGSLPNDQLISASLVTLIDYISLPIVAILRRPVTERIDEANAEISTGSTTEHPSSSTLSRRKLQIRQSAERKSIAMAAKTLKIYIEMIERGSKAKGVSSSPLSTSVSAEKVKMLIITCASALPVGREIAEQATIPLSDRGVDLGDFYIGSVLEAISSLLRHSGAVGEERDTPATNPTDLELASAMEGALLAHLADVCLAIVTPPSTFPVATLLKALQTFDQLIEASPHPLTWRSLFPGCFAGLFRTMVNGLKANSQIPQSKPKVVLASLKACIRLLRLTLKDDMLPTGQRKSAYTLADLKSITQLSAEGRASNDKGKRPDTRRILGDSRATNSNNAQSTAVQDTDPNEMFLSEVNKRLPGPLKVLASLLLSSQWELIRKESCDLHRVILLETRASWDKDIQDDLSVLSLESCLILTRDGDQQVAAAAHSVLDYYQKTVQFKQDMDSFLADRTVSLIEELPTLGQRQSEVELRSKLKLVTAILSLNNAPGKESSSRKRRSGNKVLRSTLSAEGVFINLQKAIATLLDVDFDSFRDNHSTSITLLSQGTAELDNHISRVVRRRFLTTGSELEALEMVRALGNVLGVKQSAVLVDGIVANLFNDCVARVEAGISRNGNSQTAWCHEWVGCLALAQELLMGSFPADSSPSTRSTKIDKKAKCLLSLASSMLPIMVSSPLWDLPVSPEDEHGYQQYQRNVGYYSVRALPSDDAFSTSALRGNTSIVHGLIRMIEVVIGLLQSNALSLVPTVLPPLLQLATTSKVAYVRAEAHDALEALAIAVGYKTTARMIYQNMGVVAGSILATLRLPGGRSSLPIGAVPNDTFEAAYTIRAVLELAVRGRDEIAADAAEGSSPDMERANLSYVFELVTTLTERYDCLASKSAHESETIFAVVLAYETAFRFMTGIYKLEETKARESAAKKPLVNCQPWLEHLNAFRSLNAEMVSSRDSFEEGAELSPKEGFEAYRKLNGQDQDAEEGEQPKDDKRLVSNHEIQFVSMLISRCTFFLSNSSLKLQIDSCTAMAQGFAFLAIVSLICEDPDDSTGTAILRQVNDAWPPLRARLVALTAELQASRASSIVIVKQQRTMPSFAPMADVSTKRVFVSKLFDLLAIMGECSKDFIASRFRNDVMPLFAQLLSSSSVDSLSSEPDDLETSSYRDSYASRGSPRQPSETMLIVSMLRCLSKLFDEQACGRSLADLVPSLGTMILPFLGDDHAETSQACMSAIQQMARIDCDALWRPLVQLSGGIVSFSKPWETSRHQKDDTGEDNTLTKTKQRSHLELRAAELVSFIEALPEQPLL